MPHHLQARGCNHNGCELDLLLQRTHICQFGAYCVYRQQLTPSGIGKCQFAQRHHTGERDRRFRVLHKAQSQVGIHHGGAGLHGQVGGQIRQIRGQVKARDLDLGLAFSGLGKRGSLGGRVEGAAVEFKRQTWRYGDLPLGIQVAQKGDCQVQLAQGVLLCSATSMVREIHLGVFEQQVVQRKAHGCRRLVI